MSIQKPELPVAGADDMRRMLILLQRSCKWCETPTGGDHVLMAVKTASGLAML